MTDKDTIQKLEVRIAELENALVKCKLSANILYESEEQLRLITENTVENIAIVTFDLKAIYLYVNPSVKTVLGYEPEDLIGKSFFEFIHPEDKKVLYPLLKKYANLKIKKILTGKKATITETVEYRFKNKKGEWRYLQSTINIAGKRLISISRDITERIEADNNIRQSKEKFHQYFEESPSGDFISTPEGKYIDCNQAFLTIFGFPDKKSVLKANANNLYKHKKIRDEKIIKLKESKRLINFEEELYKVNGEKFNTISNLWGEFDDNGELTLIKGFLQDITEQKRMENDLKESEEKFKNFVEISADMQFRLTKTGYIEYVSPGILPLYGYHPNELIGKHLKFTTPSKEMPKAMKAIKTLLSGKSVMNLEINQKDKAGKIIPMEINAVPVKKNEKIVGMQGIMRDITRRTQTHLEIEQKSQELNKQFEESEQQRLATLSVLTDLNETAAELRIEINERKQAEEELKIYRDNLEELIKDRTVNLEEANKELESFSYSISHDLRAPLRAIDGFTRILIEDYTSKLDKEGQRIGSVIQSNTIKMGQLIDDLLAFSRMGRTAMSYSKIDMKNMVNAIYHEASDEEERKRINFTIGDLPQINGDTSMMRQVWMNLITNAIKFSSKRKQAIIDISSKEDPDKTTYSIKDNGAGFDMKYMDKVFEVFHRLHSEKDFEGTGIGLALVRRIIVRHKGKIWAEGEVDKGATLSFSLPIDAGNKK